MVELRLLPPIERRDPVDRIVYISIVPCQRWKFLLYARNNPFDLGESNIYRYRIDQQLLRTSIEPTTYLGELWVCKPPQEIFASDCDEQLYTKISSSFQNLEYSVLIQGEDITRCNTQCKTGRL